MNKVILLGRLTSDPDVRYSQRNQPMAIARYTIAVDERPKQDGSKDTNFIRCVAFGRSAEFAEKYMHKGSRYLVEGRWKTGSYDDQKTGQKVYTNECFVDNQEFADSKSDNQNGGYGYGNCHSAYGNGQNGDYQPGGLWAYTQNPGGGYRGNQGYSGQPPQNVWHQNQQQQAPPPQQQQRYDQQKIPLYSGQQAAWQNDGFMDIPDSVEDEGLPFN